ncbi:23S rRNA (uridine(2479)-2'-O)-methyltransferase [bacterium BMS3Abin07]|nr:23S rRNA (uridine(2479)-2'-O)-methyltransferase [bacterium BMS3Abin07]GBE31407.1 23S rRNA (uridine(2479)-2'-O)-methyltransferase [bacterium BMS3Bbin05]HDL20223.1 RNA methyltransferase [Nitrospirota bacterium]HDO21440.1 RNA methyltransferase [Nitrospirota bacterium]HDZ87041.1 RNA methyltransferase [Nitrospirota bacterium]
MKRMKVIGSPSNSKVKELINMRNGKASDNLLLVEGLRVVETAVNSGHPVMELLVAEDLMERQSEKVQSLIHSRSNIIKISHKVAKRLSDTVVPQGIFAVVEYKLKSLSELDMSMSSIIPVIDGIQDPGNLGTIIRTADAFGIINMVVLDGSCSTSNQKVIRSSAGSLFNLNIAKTSPADFVNWAMGKGIRILVSDSRAKKTVDKITYKGIYSVVLGNESAGADSFLKKKADELFRIDMPGKAESLNVAIASALIFYEFSNRN